MANTKVSALTGLSSPDSLDLLYIVDVSDTTDGSGGTSKKVTVGTLLTNYALKGANSDITSLTGLTTPLSVAQGGTGAATLTGILKGNGTGAFTAVTAPSGTIVGTTDSQTLTNKTLTAPIISTISNTGTLTLPTSTDTLVGRATTDTLTNKTLTSPTINTPTITTPVVTGLFDNGNSGTSKTITWTNGDRQKVTLSGNCTFTFSGAVAGQVLTLLLIENGTGGFSITLPTIKWYPSSPSFITTANAKNSITVLYDGTDYWGQWAAGYA